VYRPIPDVSLHEHGASDLLHAVQSDLPFELRNALKAKGWGALSEDGGDGYRISGVWRIQRSTRIGAIELDFDGMEVLQGLPMAQACGCLLKGKSNLEIYCGSMRTFRNALPEFISKLDALEQNRLRGK
jgi:hypothetical protein